MPKINVYLSDELAEAVREAGLSVSPICQRALEAAVRRVTAIREAALGDLAGEDPDGRLSRFTARARAAVRLGTEQATADGASGVNTLHLLGGLLAEGGNLALQVLGALEITPAQVAGELARGAGPAAVVEPGGEGGGEGLRFSRSTADVLELAVTEALSLGHNYVGCEHLLLGLVAEPDGGAGRLLRGLGAEPRLTRRAVMAALAGYAHLRAAQQPTAPAPAGGLPEDVVPLLTAAIAREIQPLLTRIERLEAQLPTDAPTPPPA
ncbi:Clp protease N-terminal domain-containing protein [Kitasatospora sp. NPDC052896]|uniref:Clp protease N-terminal domain-containing protein n=1 Tax=Kitasatospora sp. NPDC052896 TaxID=3364061 RepID=UPI0037C76133